MSLSLNLSVADVAKLTIDATLGRSPSIEGEDARDAYEQLVESIKGAPEGAMIHVLDDVDLSEEEIEEELPDGLSLAFCATGKGGGIDPHCGKDGYPVVTKAQAKKIKIAKATEMLLERGIKILGGGKTDLAKGVTSYKLESEVGEAKLTAKQIGEFLQQDTDDLIGFAESKGVVTTVFDDADDEPANETDEPADEEAAVNEEGGGTNTQNPEGLVDRTEGRTGRFSHFKNAIDDAEEDGYETADEEFDRSADIHDDNYAAWARDVPPEQVDAMFKYAGGDFSDINDGLRAGEVDPDNKATIEVLDKAFKDAPLLAEKVTVYRGGGLTALGPDPTKMVGKTIKDKAYASTTTNVKMANGFAGKGDERKAVVRYDITLPAGTKALSIDAVLGKDSLKQHELTLKRGSKYKITAVTPTRVAKGITYWNVKATLVK